MNHQPPHSRWSRLAWVPVPTLLLAILVLWVVDLHGVQESRWLVVLLNGVFTGLATLCIAVLTARGFLAGGRPGLFMFGCGSLMWGFNTVSAGALVDTDPNAAVTLHNLGVLGAAACHLAGLFWRGTLPRPWRWLVAGYAAVPLVALLVYTAALAGWTPVFFVQGVGGTPIRQVVLLLAIGIFSWVAMRMLADFRHREGSFYYWYGLGLALVATGLIGLALQPAVGSLLGWTGRLGQWLGAAYLLAAALDATRGNGGWKFPLEAIDDSGWQGGTAPGSQPPRPLAMRYTLAVLAVAAAWALRLALIEWCDSELPPYIVFFPMIMAVALLAGFGPGLLATAIAALTSMLWLLAPVGSLAVTSQADRVGLAIFGVMGFFMSFLVEIYQRERDKAAEYVRDETLRESRTRLAAFGEATFEGIVELEDGRIVDCNDQFARMMGRTVPELIGTEISNITAPEDLGRVLANIDRGDDTVIEHSMVSKDGSRIQVEAHGRSVSPGSARRLTAIRDITANRLARAELMASRAAALNLMEDAISAREQTERAATELREGDHRMRLATEATGVGIWERHVHSGRIRWDAQMFRIYGITPTPDGFLDQADWQEAVLPEDLARQEEILEDTFRRNGTSSREFRIRRQDNGEQRYIQAVDTVRENPNGPAEWMVGTNLDITSKHEAEKALRRSEQFALAQWAEVEATLEAVPAHVAIVDSTGVIMRVNSAWRNFARENGGTLATTDLGANYLAVCDAATGAEIWQSKYFASGIRSVIAGNSERFSMEYPCHAPGERRWFMGYVTASRGEGDARAVIAHVDISAQKRTEEQIRQLNEALELRVTERTIDLRKAIDALETEFAARRRLEREILEISEREQSRLGQDLHDGLGQELAGIALIGKVHAEKLRAEAHPAAETAANIAGYIRESIECTRRLAKGLYPIELSRYGLLLALEDLARQTTQRFGIQCELRATGTTPNLGESADIHVYRIVQESIGNAIKHGPASKIVIESIACPGLHTFVVTNNGTDFEKPAAGPGMGLHLMEYRARVIDAKITVEKPEQGGCRVICSLPL